MLTGVRTTVGRILLIHSSPLPLQVQVEKRSFAYDHVFGWSSAAPTTLYDRCIQPLVDGIFRGYNATVFAYGEPTAGASSAPWATVGV